MIRFPSRRSFNLWFSVAALLLLETTIAQRRREDVRASTSVHRSAEQAGAFARDRGVTELSRLPLPAQATISQALGRDDRAYRAVAVGPGFRVENARHGLNARFSAAGVEVSSELDRLTLRLRAYGYGEALRPVAGAAPQAEANRIVYRRGTLSEWYVNGPLGLEQGFTLQAPPAGREGGPLTLSLTVGGTLTPRMEAKGDGLTFASSSLRYGGLFAIDADGRELPTRIELDERTVVLRVDDDRARYPLTIDPVIQQAQLTASDGAANDVFGRRVALSGDTALVGASGDDVGANANQGSAYVFTRAGAVWTEQAKLTASDGAMNDVFGTDVALSGDTALVGAEGDDVGANANQGSAYVFTRTGGVWTEQAKLTAGDGAMNDRFGLSVALSGETALVGAYQDDLGPNAADQGSAYVFTRAGAVWTQQAKLTASDGAVFDYFGWSVAVNGDTALVGAFVDDVGANEAQGSAYVFTRVGTVWTQQAQLTASDGVALDRFGVSVALSGDTALVGADGGENATTDHGSAYVFTRVGAVWTQQATLTASDGAAQDQFGYSVALSGDTALVGARADNVGLSGDQGSAHVFRRVGTVWTQQARLTASDGAVGDQFGNGVALSGDTALVGTWFDDVGANLNQGSAYVFIVMVPTTLTLDPLTDTSPVNSQHCVTATVLDAAGNPVPDVTVRFTVIGTVNTSGSATTNASGDATFCYNGPPQPGADAITAYADANNDNTQDVSEPGGTAGKTWVCVVDSDGDGVCDDADNCPNTANPDQADADGDGIGNACDTDADNDGVADSVDNCPTTPNPDQADADGDGIGNACDTDADNDGVADGVDNCPTTPNPGQADTDGDGLGNACDADDDGDGVPDNTDAFPLNPAEWIDTDGDGLGNNADPDDDNDGFADGADACPIVEGPANGCPFNAGGQSATVNPFLSYASPADSSTSLPAGTTNFAVTVYYGATTVPGSFEATLNSVSFGGFAHVPGGKQRVVVPLRPGRNVLLLRVSGIKPNGGRGSDTDRLVFLVPTVTR